MKESVVVSKWIKFVKKLYNFSYRCEAGKKLDEHIIAILVTTKVEIFHLYFRVKFVTLLVAKIFLSIFDNFVILKDRRRNLRYLLVEFSRVSKSLLNLL